MGRAQRSKKIPTPGFAVVPPKAKAASAAKKYPTVSTKKRK